MSLTPSPAAPPSSPWSDGQIVSGQGVTYKYDLANNRLKVYQNSIVNVSAAGTVNGTAIVEASLTPDKTNFAATFSVNTPPGSPAVGSMYVVGASPTGAWTGLTNHLEICTATTPSVTWQDVAPYEGLLVWDMVANALMGWNGTTWTAATPVTSSSIPSSTITTAMLTDNSVTVQKANFKVVSKTTSSAPGGASIGDAYIVAATPGGGDAWFGQTGNLAIKTGATNTAADWTFYSPASGHLYWVNDVGALYGWNGSAYIQIGPVGASATATAIGGLSVGDTGLVALANTLAAELITSPTSLATLIAGLAAASNSNTQFLIAQTEGTAGSSFYANASNNAWSNNTSLPVNTIRSLINGALGSFPTYNGTATPNVWPSGSISIISRQMTAGSITGVLHGSHSFAVTFNSPMSDANYNVFAVLTDGIQSYSYAQAAFISKTVNGFTVSANSSLAGIASTHAYVLMQVFR